MGALPLAKKADSDANDVKDRLDKLTKKITDAAEKVAAPRDIIARSKVVCYRLSTDQNIVLVHMYLH